MQRNIYLNAKSLEEVVNIIEGLDIVPKIESIPVTVSLLRICANAVVAKNSCPAFTSAAMDGIAVLSQNTFSASEKNILELNEHIDFEYINTGEAIPNDYDSVIMIEDVIDAGKAKVKIAKACAPFANVRPVGEDIAQSEIIISSRHKITPPDIGAMLSGGITYVNVYAKPCVGIMPTGSELVAPGTPLKKGSIIESNSSMFAAYIKTFGGIPKIFPIVKDDFEAILTAVKLALNECDMLIIGAGSSAGSRDYTVSVIEKLGKVFVHGIAIKPGKPCIIGEIDGKIVVGVPGYPVSACMVMENIVCKIISRFTLEKPNAVETKKAILSKNVLSGVKQEEFVRVKLGSVSDKLIATPLPRGAGMLTSLVRSDAIIRIERDLEGLNAGSEVLAYLRRDFLEILHTVVITGSHDPVIDILGDLMQRKGCGAISSSHVGSLGGLLALKKGEAHVAPIHLLDEETGEYNTMYLKKYLPDREVELIKFVKRTQGLMVKKGNPKGITGVADLVRKDVVYINRQKGAGTRILLDFMLKQQGINPTNIYGYNRCEVTHLSTAAAVNEGSADCALGILSAANALNLDFIPVCAEEYDFAIPKEFISKENIIAFISLLKDDEFIQQMLSLGGYEI